MQPDLMSRDAYEILGLPRGVAIDDVRNAFRKLALKYHPDVAGGDDPEKAHRDFVRINKAYEVLQDPETRQRYDRLLAGGLIPDLDHEIPNQPPTRGLGEILVEIDSLAMPDVDQALLKRIDRRLRELLEPRFFRNGQHRIEVVLDGAQFHRLIDVAGIDKPKGTLTEGWVLVTNLRLIMISWNTHVYQSGNTRYTEHHPRMVGIPFVALKHLRLHTSGRARARETLEAADDSGSMFHVDFPAAKVPRLLLITGAYRLPLRVRVRSRPWRALAVAMAKGLSPAIAWSCPFLCLALGELFQSMTNGIVDRSNYSSLLSWLNECYLTTAALYLTGPLLAFQWLRYDRAWNDEVRANEVFGRLPVDYALGRDAATQAREGGGPLEAVPEADDLGLRWLTSRLAAEGASESISAATTAMTRS